MRGFSGVLFDVIKSERLVMLAPIAFVNFFAIGFVLHGVVYAFKTLDFSQILICVTLSMLVFFGELVLLLIPVKVIVDAKMVPELEKNREIIRLTFADQDKEIFRRVKLASNSIILILTALVNYFMIALFIFMWYSNNGQPLPVHTIINSLVPVYGFFIVLNFMAGAYDLVRGKK